jgi:hypothetical protein
MRNCSVVSIGVLGLKSAGADGEELDARLLWEPSFMHNNGGTVERLHQPSQPHETSLPSSPGLRRRRRCDAFLRSLFVALAPQLVSLWFNSFLAIKP